MSEPHRTHASGTQAAAAPSSSEPAAGETLTRGLKNRHLQLIAIGGAIGTGLFFGSGKLISLVGPALLLVYLIIGFMLFLVMRALGELLLSNLSYKTFGDIAKDRIAPGAGFAVSWNYWLSWVVGCVADLVAITAYVQYFWPEVPIWLPALATAVGLILLNLQPVKAFGEVEFWFAIIKIIAILALIFVGVVLVLTGYENGDGTRAAAGRMRGHGGGAIVNISSISGKVGLVGQTNYSAAKAGIVGLTKAAAKEVAFAGVRVNAVQPGLIRTAMTLAMPQQVWDEKMAEIPMGRPAEPAEVAQVVLFLASEMSSYMTGTVLEITGGRHI